MALLGAPSTVFFFAALKGKEPLFPAHFFSNIPHLFKAEAGIPVKNCEGFLFIYFLFHPLFASHKPAATLLLRTPTLI